LNWHLSRGLVPLPKTGTASRLTENLNVFDFKLTEEEVKAVNKLETGVRICDPRQWPGFNNAPVFH